MKREINKDNRMLLKWKNTKNNGLAKKKKETGNGS